MKGYYETPVSERLSRMVNLIYDFSEGLTDENSYGINLGGIDITDYMCEDAAEMMESYALRIIDASLNEFDTLEEAVACLGYSVEEIKAEMKKYARIGVEDDIIILKKGFHDSELLSKLFILVDVSFVSHMNNKEYIIDMKRGLPKETSDYLKSLTEGLPPQAPSPEQKINDFIKKHGASNVYSILSLSSLGLD